ncbi:NlpC/P60 family protein [Nonomuraea jiangxiensis]|uniref:Cell wall-associated hydrolase, NlpC family n=1 Tax=Nonomuraea jiangxiensis TaxID=633440 RepID=A0A1G8H2A6_9ACTN|nr:NlpC/P60 family protein [Nonomuraea jiangxiensis]SDI00785.1 Cell wall-associated hydrolase, NlpC family [Nonomuraea jiangxiensis]
MRFGRVPVAVGLAIGLVLLPTGPAGADPEPTIGQAKAKLDKLNDRADKVVDRFNTANERYKKARTAYTKLNDSYKRKLATVADLRDQVISMAVESYKTGNDVTAFPGLFGTTDPEDRLAELALAEQVTRERAEKLAAFDRANRGLKADRDKAQEALESADKERDGVEKERSEVLKLIVQQKKLLRKLGAYNQGNPNSTGIEYTGPASGNAAAVLRFAFAQVGKPYVFGGTGPGGYDCSGLTQAAWRAAGVSLPRTTWEQWAWGAKRKVPLNSLQPGDLIFSEGLGHVSIYAGNGKIVHAPQTGDVVKVVPLASSGRSIVGAVRP